ncbi:MAG TPA: TolC family protein [Bryobacteraceae bacterium]|jgi:outer membrane protein TolC|nr:TolC family protein [Bryobacteraceae bacterium]
MSSAVAGFWLLAAGCAALFGQSLTINQAVEGALKNYPAIRVSQEQISAAAAGIQLARTSYLPRVDLLAQANRATRNNVFGLLLPQNVIPSMSGPVIGSNNFGTAWGSAAGVLVSWEPFDFGLRSANVAAAAALRTEAEATLQRTRYDVAVATADAYLTLAATEETVRAAQAAVDRAETISRTIQALVNAGLRPGADASRAQAELAAARTQWIQAKQATEVARSTVSQFVGVEPNQIALAAPKLLELPPAQDSTPLDSKANPIAVEQDAVVERAKAQLHALERSYFPRFSLQGSAYARGTGAETNGPLLGGLNGLGPTVQDYALGFTVTFPAMDLPAIQARRAAQSANVRAETARYQQIATDLRARWNVATARLRGAREVVANTPVQVSAARAALQQSTARYQSGLANVDEVAEAQRLLTQAEIDDALARLSVWRALLEIAAVAGDLQPFLAEASQ